MKYATCALILLLTAISPASGQETFEPIEVMILGTAHFRGGGGEYAADRDNFMSPERQAQILEVVSKLEAFQPDKIMLEMDPSDEEAFNAKYDAYLAGEHELTVNERQQLGMRLAARLGHNRLYGVDYDSFLDYRPALKAAEDLNQKRLLAERKQYASEADAKFESEGGLELDELLIKINTPDSFSGNEFYLTIAQMGTVENPQGALQIITWWERNLVMFARTAQYSEPGEKILFIVGAGHNTLLNQFFSEARGFKVVSPVPYLEATATE